MVDYKVTPLESTLDFDSLEYWDVVIIGAGPAGLAAGLTTAHRGLTTLILEAKDKPGGQPQFLYPDKRVVDIPGFPDGITGEEIAARVYRQAVEALVQFRFNEELSGIEDTEQCVKDEPLRRVITVKTTYLCRKIIIACGLLHFPRRLPILDALGSRKVYYKIPRIGDYEDLHVAIVGGGDSALDSALMILQRHGQVDLLIRGKNIAGKADSLKRVLQLGGRVHMTTEITAVRCANDSIALSLTDGRELLADLVIVQIGFLSAREMFQPWNVRLNEDGSIAIDAYYETSRPGIFAVGDVHGDIKLITVAWAEGIQAAIYAFKEITSPYWLNEKRLHDHRIPLTSEKISRVAEKRSRNTDE